MIFSVMLAAFVTLSGMDLDWSIPPGCSSFMGITNGILTIELPENVSPLAASASAKLDLSACDRSEMEIVGKVCSSNGLTNGMSISRCRVALSYLDPQTGKMRHPRNGLFGKPAESWEDVSLCVSFGEVPPPSNPMPTLYLGAGNARGKVIFDLRSLVIRKVDPASPVTDSDRKVCYPPRMSSLPVLRGVMSRGAWRNTEKDIDDLHKMGVSLVRLQMNAFSSMTKDREPTMEVWNEWFARWLGHIDEMLGWIESRGMKMVLDMHNPPVGGYGHSCRTFYYADYASRFVSAWEEIARRYRGRRGLYGYDLINEPVQQSRALPDCDYWNLQRRAAESIRRIDPQATIVVESSDWDSPGAFANLCAFDMDNVIYEAHMYYPAWFTHQFAAKGGKRQFYPGRSDKDKISSKNDLRKFLRPVRDFQLRHDCRILIGEFSASVDAPGAAEYLSDCIDIFAEYGWDWTYHSFREARAWNVEMIVDENGKSVLNADNPRYFVLSNGFGASVPVEVENRELEIKKVEEVKYCTVKARIDDYERAHISAFAAIEFNDPGAIDDSVVMTVVDSRGQVLQSVAYLDFQEAGRKYRAFKDVLKFQDGSQGDLKLILTVRNRIGVVRLSGVRVREVQKIAD